MEDSGSENNSWDDDDSYGDGDEFELEESLDQLPASPNKVETANAENNEEKNQNNNRNKNEKSSNDEDDYEDSDFDDEDEQRDTPTKLQPPQPVSSPRQRITDRGRGRHASLLQPLSGATLNNLLQFSEDNNVTTSTSSALFSEQEKSKEQHQPLLRMKNLRGLSIVESGSPTGLNLPNWGEKERKEKPHSIKNVKNHTVSSGSPTGLQLPTWDERSFGEEKDTAQTIENKSVGKEFPSLFNRDLTQTQHRNKVDSDQTPEYLSPSTSAAVAIMMKRCWAKSRAQQKSRATTNHETDRVLAWLADVAQPKAMAFTSTEATLHTTSQSQWTVNPDLQEPPPPLEPLLELPPPHTSNILAALADAPATPGSLEENVLEVVYSSLMDELQYPRGKMNRHKNLTEEEEEDHLFQQEYQTVSKRKDRSALEQLRRRKTQLSTTTAYSLPTDRQGRRKAEDACEQSYLNLVRRACLNKPGSSTELARSSGLSIPLARQVQKELIGVVCDMFTDPTIVSTIKTAVLSRVFAGQPLDSGARELSP